MFIPPQDDLSDQPEEAKHPLKDNFDGISIANRSSNITPDTDIDCPGLLIPKKFIANEPIIVKKDDNDYVLATIRDTPHNKEIIENTDMDLFGVEYNRLLPSKKEERQRRRKEEPFRFDITIADTGTHERISESHIKRYIENNYIYSLTRRWKNVRVLSGGKSGAFIFLVNNPGSDRRILKLYPNAYTKENLMREERCFREAYSLCKLNGKSGYPTVFKIGNCRWPSRWNRNDKRVPKKIDDADLFLFVEMSSAKNDHSIELGSFNFNILNALNLENIESISQKLLDLLQEAKNTLGDQFQHYDFHPDNIFIKFNKKVDDIQPDDSLTVESIDIIDFDLVDSNDFGLPQYQYYFDKDLGEHDTKKGGFVPERTVQFILQLLGIKNTFKLNKEFGIIRDKLSYKIKKYQKKIQNIRSGQEDEPDEHDEDYLNDDEDGIYYDRSERVDTELSLTESFSLRNEKKTGRVSIEETSTVAAIAAAAAAAAAASDTKYYLIMRGSYLFYSVRQFSDNHSNWSYVIKTINIPNIQRIDIDQINIKKLNISMSDRQISMIFKNNKLAVSWKNAIQNKKRSSQTSQQILEDKLDYYQTKLNHYLNTDIRNWFVIIYALLTHYYEKDCKRTDCSISRRPSEFLEKQRYLLYHSGNPGKKTKCVPTIPQLNYIDKLKKCNEISSCRMMHFNTTNLDDDHSTIFTERIMGRYVHTDDKGWMSLIPGISFLTRNQDLAASYLLFEEKVRCTTGFYPVADNIQIKCITTWSNNFKILAGVKPVSNLSQALRFEENNNKISKEYLSFGLMNNPFMYDPNVGVIEAKKNSRGNDLTVIDIVTKHYVIVSRKNDAERALHNLQEALENLTNPPEQPSETGWRISGRSRGNQPANPVEIERKQALIAEKEKEIETIKTNIDFSFKTTIFKTKVFLDDSLKSHLQININPTTNKPVRLIGNILDLTEDKCSIRIRDTYEIVDFNNSSFHLIKIMKNNTAGKIQCITDVFFKQALPTFIINFKSLSNGLIPNINNDGIFIEFYDLYALLIKLNIIDESSLTGQTLRHGRRRDISTEYLDYTLINTHLNSNRQSRPGVDINNSRSSELIRISMNKFIIEFKSPTLLRISIRFILHILGIDVMSLGFSIQQLITGFIQKFPIQVKNWITKQMPTLQDATNNVIIELSEEIKDLDQDQLSKDLDKYLNKCMSDNKEVIPILVESILNKDYSKISPRDDRNKYVNNDQLNVIKTITRYHADKDNLRWFNLTLDIHVPEGDPHPCLSPEKENKECFESLFSIVTGLLSNAPNLRQVFANILSNLDSFHWEMLYMPCKKGKWEVNRLHNDVPVKYRGHCVDWTDAEKQTYRDRPWLYGSLRTQCRTELLKTGWNIANPNLNFFLIPTQKFIIDQINKNSAMECCGSLEELAQFIQSAQIVLRDTPGDPRSLARDGVKRMLKNFVDQYYADISQQLFDENFDENIRRFTQHQRHLGRLTRQMINR